MSDKTPEDANPSASEEQEGGLLPALLAGAGILAVVALLVLWPSSGEDAAVVNASGADGAQAASAGAADRGVVGGVPARAYDDPSRPPGKPQINPAVKLPAVGMAPSVPPKEEPPAFANRQEEIAWYERKLEQAIKARDSREKFAERLPQIRKRIEQSDNPKEGLAAFEGRKKIVEDNFTKAKAKVEEIEQKLRELRGQ